jgi:hypothetical protein
VPDTVREIYTFVPGAVASTVKFPAALSAEQIQRQGKEMSKHDTVPAPVEEYEYAESA